jgi:predicted CXXCH cytochrome family protein
MATASVSRVLRRLSPPLTATAVGLVMLLTFSAMSSPASAVDPTVGPSAGADPTPLQSPATVDPSGAPDPSPSPTGDPNASPTPDPGAEPSAEPTVDPSTGPGPAPAPGAELRVDHVWLDAIDPKTGAVVPGALDAAGTGIERGRIYVVRFQVVNGSDAEITLQPVLEFEADLATATWLAVPAVNPVEGVAFYTSSNVRRGEAPGSAAISVAELRLASSADPAGLAATGIDYRGVNPGSAMTLAAHAYTEVAFTFRTTPAADWLTAFALRLTDGGESIAGAGVGRVVTGARPQLQLSPGQQAGVDVEPPVVYRPSQPGSGTGTMTTLDPLSTSPHGPYTLTSDVCAACHKTHTAQAPMLLNQPSPESELCFTCHDGSPATNIKGQYTDPAVPTNNPAADLIYSHTATQLTGPACTECHQPHLADGTPAVETTNGWTASGAIFGAAGVSVVNGAAGDAPTYTPTKTSTFEYQLCFKCHAGAAVSPDPTGPPSTWLLDKGVELNPANNSYHPIEAPGKNQSAQLNLSLSGDPTWGTSPYKLWNFTTGSTVRCVSCHGDSRLGNPLSPPDAGGRLAPHAVANRGILIENLRDRVLKGNAEAYQAADFALCYVCHAEAPFVDTSQSPLLDTNFPLHGMHTAGIATFTGAGGTVDQDGAGHGNALCAECHFRTHGTAFAVDGQPAWSGLVNFAPNVQPYQGSELPYAGKLEWSTTSHTCTLTCHGIDHAGWSY